MCLGGVGVDGHVDAEGFELAEVAADLAVAAGLLVVPAGAEVGEPGLGVGQEVLDDECDTRSHMLRVNLADWRASMTWCWRALFRACALSLSLPRRACAGPVRVGAEPGGKPEGSPSHPGATGEGKAGRAKNVNP